MAPGHHLSSRTAIVTMMGVALTLCACTIPAEPQVKKVASMTQSEHPGTIRIENVSAKTVEIVPYDSVPQRQQFVMLDANGVETNNPGEAKERVPIVYVRVIMLDEKGQHARPEYASSMQILEYGPNERFLRSTIMQKP